MNIIDPVFIPISEKGREHVNVEVDQPGASFRKSVLALFSLFSLAVFIALTIIISISS